MKVTRRTKNCAIDNMRVQGRGAEFRALKAKQI
jgi:hypothetical protein